MDYGSKTGAGEDMYSDAPPAPDSAAPDEEEAQGGTTALIPKSLCPGMKPGDMINLKIDRVHDDQYQVSYIPEQTEETGEEQAAPPEASPDQDMASMMG